MADITKVTTPMIPRENMGTQRPVSDQAFELTDQTKVHKPRGENAKITDQEAGKQALRDMLGRAAMAPLLRDGTETIQQLQKMITMLQMGISTSDIVNMDPMKELVNSLFVNPDALIGLLLEQDEAATLFKGEPFDVLRDILAKFEGNINVKQAIAALLKSFEFNVNLDNSIKTILYQCENLLDFMFSQDRTQFGDYLDNLAKMLLPKQAKPQQQDGQVQQQDGQAGKLGASPYAGSELGVEPKEAAAILKNNLLPLLGEIVVKYYQSENIRDMVMVVVHNLVRVDKGTPEALRESVDNLVEILSKLANLNANFADSLNMALARGAEQAKLAENDVMTKIATIIANTLRSTQNNPNAMRQAEYLLMSMLQNQSSMMSLHHFILPLDLPGEGRIYAEMYVDPDSEEAKKDGRDDNGRKIFIAAESERHGTMELCFWESGERVELAMWCPRALVDAFKLMKRPLSELMLYHGYTLTSYSVDELTRAHSIIQVFPKLLELKVGIDVKI